MKSYHCSMCNYITNNKHNYNNHLLSKSHYNNANNEDRLYTCHLCNKTFSHRSSLSRHMNHSCKKRERENASNTENKITKDLQAKISEQEIMISNLKQRVSELESIHENHTPNHENKNDINNLKPIEIIYDKKVNEIVKKQFIEDLCVL